MNITKDLQEMDFETFEDLRVFCDSLGPFRWRPSFKRRQGKLDYVQMKCSTYKCNCSFTVRQPTSGSKTRAVRQRKWRISQWRCVKGFTQDQHSPDCRKANKSMHSWKEKLPQITAKATEMAPTHTPKQVMDTLHQTFGVPVHHAQIRHIVEHLYPQHPKKCIVCHKELPPDQLTQHMEEMHPICPGCGEHVDPADPRHQVQPCIMKDCDAKVFTCTLQEHLNEKHLVDVVAEIKRSQTEAERLHAEFQAKVGELEGLKASLRSRRVLCQHCSKDFSFSELATHESECPQRPVICAYHDAVPACEWSGKLGDFSDHLKTNCPHGPVECAGCGEQMTRYEFTLHQKKCEKLT
eukprot:gnl/Dysnectes_brevis/2135_a2481_1473.p1 GENE.gnl/Dysnectes_brevis/2135_a2481_1473~~gnl/Dysnectes_brevis/2135_a2481_1473.p1  ORF type:complete len:351 (+),score=89.49 gnl/Dysnectes_brevis/2135_a2481_1473:104-1156(+)